MNMSFVERLAAVDAAQLTPLVRQALADDSVELMDWQHAPVKGGISQEIGGSYGLYRFRGSAYGRGGEKRDWSLILKATAAAVVGVSPAASPEPSDLLYWKREVLAYQSGFLADLPRGLQAVRCFAVVEYPDEEYWMWLEDVEDRTWSRADYGLAAYHLGLFNGAYLRKGQLPQADWLSHGQARGFIGYGAAGMADIVSLSPLPANRLWLDADGVVRTRRLWAEHARLLSALDRLPQTFCHHDAFRRNLMIRARTAGELETVAVDWAMVGTGCVGAEVAVFVGSTLATYAIAAEEIAEFEALALTNYVNGLRATGWAGSDSIVRLAYAATVALINALGLGGVLLMLFADPEGIRFHEQFYRRPFEELMAQRAIMQRYFLDLGEEALSLMAELRL